MIDPELLKLWEETVYGDDAWTDGSRPGTPPLHQTSNFVFETLRDMQQALAREDRTPFYTRGANPTLSLVAKKLAALEGMESGLLFASGSAAIAAAILSQVSAGDKILSASGPYSWTRKLIEQFCGKYGVEHEFSDGATLVDRITDNTRVIFLESPNSWTFETQDLRSIAAIARERGITTVLDNSYATPLLQQAAAHGIDLVAHSATKYLGGHSDLVAGVLCGSEQLIREVFNGPFMTLGAALSPFEAWLLLRSLRTLPLRLEAIQKTTQAVVHHLQQHPRVRAVYFPGADQREVEAPQTGLLSIDLDTDNPEEVERFCNRLRHFKLGPSWGSHESLAFPAMATIGSMNYDSATVTINRVRLSVGLQHADSLIQDLTQALDV